MGTYKRKKRCIVTIKGKKIQFSKLITLIILFLITVTWVLGLIIYWDELDYFNYILDYTQAMALGVLPYFCLSATDRLVYMQQVRQGGTEHDVD